MTLDTETKKEQHTSSVLAEYLVERRRVLKVSLSDLSEKTGIHPRYLKRIEQGEWHELPSDVYTRGFLRTYAREVGAHPDDVIRRYENEHVVHNPTKDTKKSAGARAIRIQDAIAISPGVVRRVAILAAFAIIVGYVGYQMSILYAAPDLIINHPAEEEIVTDEAVLILSGVAERGSDITLNNQPIRVGSEGDFEKTIDLLPGLNTFTITATSRFGRSVTVERSVLYTP